jgi:hypothetical protein
VVTSLLWYSQLALLKKFKIYKYICTALINFYIEERLRIQLISFNYRHYCNDNSGTLKVRAAKNQDDCKLEWTRSRWHQWGHHSRLLAPGLQVPIFLVKGLLGSVLRWDAQVPSSIGLILGRPMSAYFLAPQYWPFDCPSRYDFAQNNMWVTIASSVIDLYNFFWIFHS